MGLNDKITEHFELTVENSSQRILDALLDQKQKQTWTDFIFSDGIDFKGIKLKDNGLEIIRIPSVWNPFKTHGRITLNLSDTDNSKVTIRCTILPYDGIFPFILVSYFVFFYSLDNCVFSSHKR